MPEKPSQPLQVPPQPLPEKVREELPSAAGRKFNCFSYIYRLMMSEGIMPSRSSNNRNKMLEKLNKHKWWIIISIGLAMVLYIVLT